MRNIQLIEVCSDIGAGTHGACFGFESLQMIAQLDTKSPFLSYPVKRCEIPVIQGFSSPFAKNIETIYSICQSVANEVNQSLSEQYFPVVISGDHSCAAGTIAGIKMAKPCSRLGVIWIDAHADLHSPFTTPSGNMHGMPLAASIGNDNKANQRQQIDLSTNVYWNRLKTLGNISPKILPQDIVYISLRDFEQEEAALIKSYGIKAISTQTVRRAKITGIVETILRQLEYCSDIYISFDTDCLDTSFSHGTGLPVDNGLIPSEAGQLLSLLLSNPKVCTLEFTELNPYLDINCETSTIMYQLLKKGINALQKQELAQQVA
jgi:Arginase/agmatinase/formimionoglutamate hydrolase, arginase family